jgi:hypothetical protein
VSARDGLWTPVEPAWLQEAEADVTLFLISLREDTDDMGTTLMQSSNAAAPAPIEWDRELRGASYLVRSGLCPSAVKSPEAALFIILAGRDLGLSPVASLRNIHIIQGKVELSADMQLSLFASRGGRFKWLEVSETAAVIELHAPWLLAPHVSKWTMADAQRAKLGGDNWQKYPKAMLRSRAITAGLKDIGFDATAGVYAPGEVDADTETTVTEEAEVVSITTATESTETGEAPTQEQLALLSRIMKSSVWTDVDRQTYQMLADKYTKRQLSNLLDEIIEIGKQRKAEARDLAEDKRIAAAEEMALR